MQQEASFLDIIDDHLANDKTRLPVFDKTSFRIQREIANPEPDMQTIEQLITSDQALTSQVLKTANSAFYRGLVKVSTVRAAIVRMGIREVANIVLLITQRKNYQSKIPSFQNMVEQLWHHSLGCAIGSQWLAKKCGFHSQTHEAFTAGLLHDIGKLLLVSVLESILLSGKINIRPDNVLLEEVIAHFHAEHGCQLMQNWNLPDIYCNIAHDHHLEEYDPNDALLTMVRLANNACNKMGIGTVQNHEMVLAATSEASRLGCSEIHIAQLEIRIEDSLNAHAA